MNRIKMCCFVWTRARMVCALITQRTEMKLLYQPNSTISLGIFFLSPSVARSHSWCVIFVHSHSLFFSCKCFYFWLENKTCGSSHIQSLSFCPSSFAFNLVLLFIHFDSTLYTCTILFLCSGIKSAHYEKCFCSDFTNKTVCFRFSIWLYTLLYIVVVRRCVCVYMCRYHIEHSIHREIGLNWIGSDQKSRTSELWRQQHERAAATTTTLSMALAVAIPNVRPTDRMNEWNVTTSLNKKQ